jgi:endonuclease/exonuclease/phosphatase family metal-dependent hydrolase
MKTARRNPTTGKQTTRKKRQSTSQFTVMTFNVELFLNLYNFSVIGDVVQSAELIPTRVTPFRNLFKNIDVACLQETYLPGEGTDSSFIRKMRIFNNKIRNLKLQGICKSHILDWATSTYLYGNPSYLANSIYVSGKMHLLPEDTASSKINMRGLERCYSSITIMVESTPIKIVSVHLIGGRFDDMEAIRDDSYLQEKIRQIQQVIDTRPDIICGDFNTKLRTPSIAENTDKYFERIFATTDGVTEQDKPAYKRRWEEWIYMDNIHEVLTAAGYKSVYYSDSGKIITRIDDTSLYGGVVDMIYYNPDKVHLVADSVAIVGKNTVMTKKEGESIYSPVLSDHFPVKATFALNT